MENSLDIKTIAQLESSYFTDGNKELKSFSPAELESAENAPSAEEPVAGKNSEWYSGGKSKNATGKAAKKGGKKRYIAIGGGGASLVVTLVLLLSSVFGFALKGFEKVMLDEADKVAKKVLVSASKQIIKKVFKKSEEKGTAADDPDADNAGPLETDIDDYDVAALKTPLAAQGIDEVPDGQGVEVVDQSSGDDLSDNISPTDQTSLEAGANVFEVDQDTFYQDVNTVQSGVLFKFWQNLKDKLSQAEEDNVEDGASEEQILETEDQNDVDESTIQDTAPAAGTTSDNDLTEAGVTSSEGPLLAGMRALGLANTQGFSTAQAIDSGLSAFNEAMGNKLLISGILTTACAIYKEFNKLNAAHVTGTLTALIRHGNILPTASSEADVGKLNSGQVNSIMQSLDGSDKPVVAGDETAMDYEQSAAYARATGQPVNTDPNSADYTPDISPTAQPDNTAANKVYNEFLNALGTVGIGASDFVCKVLTSGWSIIIQTVLAIVQVVAIVVSGSSSQIAITAAGIAFGRVLNKVILPDVFRLFGGEAVTGSEDPVQWTNNTAAGLRGSFSNVSRAQGANPVSNSTDATLQGEATAYDVATNSESSFTDRTFSTANPDSLVSKLMDGIPVGWANTATSLENYFTDFPGIFTRDFSSVFLPASVVNAAAPAANPNPYEIAQYTFQDDETTKYDPIANEQYLDSNINIPNAGGGFTVMSRISMLAGSEPATYQQTQNGETNATGQPVYNDLFHCYVDPYTLIMDDDNPTGGTDPTDNTASQYLDGAPAGQALQYNSYCGDVGDMVTSPGYVDANNPIIPTDQSVSYLYCSFSPDPAGNCESYVQTEMNDDVGHFRQYLLDLSVMNSYEELTTNT